MNVNAGGFDHEGCGLAKHHFSAYCVLGVSLTQNSYGFPLSYLVDVCVDGARPSGVCDLGRAKVNKTGMRMLSVCAYDVLGMWNSP